MTRHPWSENQALPTEPPWSLTLGGGAGVGRGWGGGLDGEGEGERPIVRIEILPNARSVADQTSWPRLCNWWRDIRGHSAKLSRLNSPVLSPWRGGGGGGGKDGDGERQIVRIDILLNARSVKDQMSMVKALQLMTRHSWPQYQALPTTPPWSLTLTGGGGGGGGGEESGEGEGERQIVRTEILPNARSVADQTSWPRLYNWWRDIRGHSAKL